MFGCIYLNELNKFYHNCLKNTDILAILKILNNFSSTTYVFLVYS